jgi:hypothetical protein
MGEKIRSSLAEQLEPILQGVPKAYSVESNQRPVGAIGDKEIHSDGGVPARRNERRACNDSLNGEWPFTEEQRQDLFDAQKNKLEVETRKIEEETRNLKNEKLLTRSVGFALFGVAASAFAVVAHALMSGRSDNN